ncbi:translation initiation factor 2 [Thermococcus argininiproducens]|uniref:Translation initiation factor 2 n=1 Tax=Thermococcus argininiproducens TaxID=2866384 RepID=A0A9E7SC93_9EURY|nr:HVO_0476 family zinc finger protein [Thermococcus argininiproducens]USG99560.1 translation initiation factor 2 [Thermococcus argininiproducens]
MEEYFICPECGSEEVEVIKERGRELTLRCLECSYVWQITLSKTIKVPVIVSKHERSFKRTAELPADEEIRIGDIVELDDDEIRITGIELEDNKRVEKAEIKEVKVLWGESLTYPKVIGVSIYFPKGITQSFKVKVNREDEFAVGEVLEVGGQTFRIEKIKIEGKMLRYGKAKADEIVRIMGRPIRGKASRSLKIYKGYGRE